MLWEYRERAHNLLSHVCLGARLLCLRLKFVIAEIGTTVHIERLLEKKVIIPQPELDKHLSCQG